MTDRPTQKQQIADLNRVIDRQAAQIGKMRTRLDAAAELVTAAQEWFDMHDMGLSSAAELMNKRRTLRTALAAACAAGFEIE